jgi:hypothetical protein
MSAIIKSYFFMSMNSSFSEEFNGSDFAYQPC